MKSVSKLEEEYLLLKGLWCVFVSSVLKIGLGSLYSSSKIVSSRFNLTDRHSELQQKLNQKDIKKNRMSKNGDLVDVVRP